MLDFCSGGELQYHLAAQPGKKIKEGAAKFYCAELVVCLIAMHNKYHVVHRDLKPENVLLEPSGHIALIDFNIATKCDDKLQIPNPDGHHIGTLPYMAPELLKGENHSAAVDWWGLGIILYEMTHGEFPHTLQAGEKRTHETQLKSINNVKLSAVCRGSKPLLELLQGLLAIDPKDRWNEEQVKKSAWLADIDWDAVEKKKMKPPIIPSSEKVNFNHDLQMEESLGVTKVKDKALSATEQEKYTGWDWVNPDQELDPSLVYVDKKTKKLRDSQSHGKKA